MIQIGSLIAALDDQPDAGPTLPLTALHAGERAIIVEVRAERASAKRLADMGFVRGSGIEMLRPGRPCIVRIGHTCVGLGKGHQESLLVRRIQPDPVPDSPKAPETPPQPTP